MRKAHWFSGFGPGPYRVVGYQQKIHQACQGAPIQAGGSCDYCGTAIMHAYTIRCADGVEFVVGCDCVRKVDRELVKECAAVRRDSARKMRREAREAAERSANGGKTRSEIWAEERAVREATRKAEAEAREMRRLSSQWVGTVGKRETFELIKTGHFSFESNFGYRPTLTILYFFEDVAGNRFVWKTSAGFGRLTERGEKILVKATVKKHDTYKEAKQTTLTRVSEIISEKSIDRATVAG